MVAVLVAVTLIGSLLATTTLLQHKASAGLDFGGKDFKKLSKQFQSDVLDLVGADPPDPDVERQLAMLFDNYVLETWRIFGLTPPS